MKWARRIPENERPAILNEKHKDWPPLLRWVPRSWTSWLGDLPEKIAGSAPLVNQCPEHGSDCGLAYPKPIPEPGEWWVGRPLYIAVKTRRGWYFRAGFRFDDVDWYYALSLTIKKYKT